jgi:cellulose biosynthesis protein BcsQ
MAGKAAGQVITFYSYKGGAGRSMALVNTACLLSREQFGGNRVLMVDWDLEAPGLHLFFHNRLRLPATNPDEHNELLEQHPGLIDLFQELYQAVKAQQESVAEDEGSEQTRAQAEVLVANIDLDQYILKTEDSRLDLLKAGCFDGDYSARVNTFGWEQLYNWSPWLFRAFAERLATDYDYVLIDSRTGRTDISNICTMLMPERLVVVFTPTRQSLTGIQNLILQATSYRKNWYALVDLDDSPDSELLVEAYDERPLVILPLPSRIDDSEKVLREQWRFGSQDGRIQGYQPLFEQLFQEVYGLSHCSLEAYFNDVRIDYVPYFSYGEEIAVDVEVDRGVASLTHRYESFTRLLVSDEYPWNYRGRTDMTTVVVDQKYLTKLRSLLVEYFNEEELRDLCFTMGIDYESLPGEGMKGKTREILTFLERHNRIPELVEVVRDSRPDLAREPLPL